MSAITLFFGGLLGVASWLSPNHYPPWLAFHADLLMGVAMLLVLAGELASSPPSRQPISPLLGATLLTMCVPLAQAAAGLIPFAGDAWMAFAYLLGFALAQILGQLLSRRIGADALLERLSALFLTASLACVGLQLFQWLRLSGLGIFMVDLAPGHSPYANVAQPNQLASMLFLGVVGLLFLYERGRVRGVAAALAYLMLAGGLVMTGSRTAWLTMALAAVALWLACGRAPLQIGRSRIVGAAVAFLLMLVAWAPLNELLLLSPGRSFAVQTQVGPRPLLWATMLDAISRQPWFGYGWGQGLVAHSRVVDQHPAGGRLMESSHNLPLDLMVWTGVPLALLLCALLAWWFWRQLRASRSAAPVCLLAGVSGVFVHALLEYPLSYAYFLLPVGMMMGTLDALAPTRLRWHWPKAMTTWVLTCVAGGLLALISIDYMAVESNVRTLRLETARIGTHKITSEAPTLRLLSQWGAYLNFARIEPKPGMDTQTLAWMATVVERFPYASAQYNLAAANALNGRPEKARALLARLCNMHRQFICAAQLDEWRVRAIDFPSLAAVPLPVIPPAASR